MSFKPFYVHINRGPGKRYSKLRGATVLVSPAKDKTNRFVTVQVTYCSKRDQFCKKTGRSQAEQAPAEVINVRKLATFLADVDYRVSEGLNAEISAASPFNDGSEEFHYVYKYMV